MNAITDFQISKVDQHNQHLGNFSQMDCQNPTNQPTKLKWLTPLGHVFITWLWCEQPETILTHLIFRQVSEYFEKARKLEGRVASDQDLKTSDLLRYYVRDTDAAKNLLYRRARCLADYENANKALDKARVKGKEIAAVSNHEIIRCK